MRPLSVLLTVCLLMVAPNMCLAQDEPPPDPYDALAAAVSQLADLVQTLKPAANDVTAKEAAVARKEAELADAKTAEQSAKETYNQTLADIVTALDSIKAAVLQIPPAGGGGDPPAPAPGG